MTKVSYLVSMLVVSAIFIFSSCAKDGDTGPAGKDGSANVMAVSFTVEPIDWEVFGSSGNYGHGLYFDKTMPLITADILQSGMVIGYLNFQGGYHIQLPWIDFPNNSNTASFHGVSSNQNFRVTVVYSSLTTPLIFEPTQYKVVIVPGTARVMNPDLDWNNFQQVASRFEL